MDNFIAWSDSDFLVRQRHALGFGLAIVAIVFAAILVGRRASSAKGTTHGVDAGSSVAAGSVYQLQSGGVPNNPAGAFGPFGTYGTGRRLGGY